MVPLTRSVLQIDLLACWRAPVVLCASTRLGTINHTLLSLEALKARTIPVIGIAFIGPEAADSETVIPALSGVRRLGRLPWLTPLEAASLRQAFLAGFRLEDFRLQDCVA
jgi:dethiobiotin synthetase